MAVVGLGYVGLPLAVEFGKIRSVIGFDINESKIDLYKSGIDPTNEVGNDVIKQTSMLFTNDETKIRDAKFHIVAVPTPINPILTLIISSSFI